jgi:membrane protein required for beta-lactamase induction
VAYFIVGGVSVGVGLVRVFIHSVSQETVTVIGITCFFIVALLCSLGSVNFIKCFLIAKYQFESDGLEELILDQLKESREKMSLIKKLLLILLAIFMLLALVGVIETS